MNNSIANVVIGQTADRRDRFGEKLLIVSLLPVSVVSACCRKHLNGLLITTTSWLLFIFTASFRSHKTKECHTAGRPDCIGFSRAQDLYRFKPHTL